MRVHNVLFVVLLGIACVGLSAEESSGRREEIYATLKAHLMREFTAIDGTERATASWIRQNLGADDEQIRKVMMDIYREATLAYRSAPDKDSRPLSRMRLEGVIRELGGCADDQTKGFLMDYAASKENDSYNRSVAVFSYLRAADAVEAKDVLLRFLIGEERMNSQARSSICEYARTAFMAADAEKKAAILNSLYVALSMEDTKWLFRVYDNLLCELSNQYADSHQRLTILQRLINTPSLCKADDYAMPELQEKLNMLQKTRLRSNISTNLAALTTWDINLPQPSLLTNNVVGPDLKGSGTESKTADVTVQIAGRYAFFAMLTLLLLSFGAWRFMRK